MKHVYLTIFLFFFLKGNSQEIFEYEKEISNKQNYSFKEITFKNKLENINLSGTLITPKNGCNKIVIIVPGSGLDTRHSHYKLAEELLENNIGVYRYDERGVGNSEGENSQINYGISDITNDLISAIEAIRTNENIQIASLGLIGHSQGGMATAGALKNGANIDFLVQWSAPTQKHAEFLKYQIKTGVNNFDDELIYDDINRKIEIISVAQRVVDKNLQEDDLKLSKKITKEAKKHGHKRRNYKRFQFWTFPSRKDLLRQNYEDTYLNTKIPILYIIGSKDIFIDPKANSELLKNFNNPLIEIDVIEGLNHFLTNEKMDPSALKMSSTYYKIDNEASSKIIQFIKEQ